MKATVVSQAKKQPDPQPKVIIPAPPWCCGQQMAYAGKQAGWRIYECQKCGRQVAG